MANKTYRTRFPVIKLNRKVDFRRRILAQLPRAGGRKGRGISRRES